MPTRRPAWRTSSFMRARSSTHSTWPPRDTELSGPSITRPPSRVYSYNDRPTPAPPAVRGFPSSTSPGDSPMRRWLLALPVLCLAVLPAAADDWPQWLGPKRDGVWREKGILDTFPKDGPKVRWRQKVG